MRNLLWIEKYRPKEIGDVVGDFKKIESYMEDPQTLPHLLFLGPAGTGKTTVAKIIIRKLQTDSIMINASDETGVDAIRERVKKFACTQNSVKGIPKIVFLDEADYLSKNAQATLRSIIETYSSNCRFILTGNYERKIIDPLKSRCDSKSANFITVQPQVVKYLEKILKKEKKDYEIEALNKIVSINFPDIRKCVKEIQTLDSLKASDIKRKEEKIEEVWTLIKACKVLEARKFWITNNMDARELIKELFHIIVKVKLPSKGKLLSLCALYDYRMSVGGDSDIQLTDFVMRLGAEMK